MLYIIYISVDDDVNYDTYYFNTNMIYNNNTNREYFLLEFNDEDIEDKRKREQKLNQNIKKNLDKLFRNTILKQRDRKNNRYYIRSYRWDYKYRTSSRKPWFIKRLEQMIKRPNISPRVKQHIQDKLSQHIVIRVHVDMYLLHENATLQERFSSFKKTLKLDCKHHRKEFKRKRREIKTRKEREKEERREREEMS